MRLQLLKGVRRAKGLVMADGSVAFALTQRAEGFHAAIKDLIRDARRGELGIDEILRRCILLFNRQKAEYRKFLVGESAEWHANPTSTPVDTPPSSSSLNPNPHNVDLPNLAVLLRQRIPHFLHPHARDLIAFATSSVSTNSVIQRGARQFLVLSSTNKKLHHNVTFDRANRANCDCESKEPFCSHMFAVGLVVGNVELMIKCLPIHSSRSAFVGLEDVSSTIANRRAGRKPGERSRRIRSTGSPVRDELDLDGSLN